MSVDNPHMDEVVGQAAADAWSEIAEELGKIESWLLDPEARVSRREMASRLDVFASAILREMLDAVKVVDLRLREVRHEERDACEEVLGSEHDRVGIRERYAVALRILEDAHVGEVDILAVAKQADPLACLRAMRGLQPKRRS